MKSVFFIDLDNKLIGSFIPSFHPPFFHSFIPSFIHSSIHSVIHSFIHSFVLLQIPDATRNLPEEEEEEEKMDKRREDEREVTLQEYLDNLETVSTLNAFVDNKGNRL